MVDGSIDSATNIYACQAVAEIEHHGVRHPQFREFSLSLRRFLKELCEAAEDEYWSPLVRSFKRYRFEASVAPVGFGHSCLMPPETLSKMESHLSKCPLLFPEFYAQSTALIESLKALVSANENPLLEEVIELAAPEEPLTVALKEPRHVPLFEQVLSTMGLENAVTTVSEAQLRGMRCHEKIVCIGAGCWYDDYVFRAPRAPHIVVVKFEWIHDQMSRGPVFEGWERVRLALNITKRKEEKVREPVAEAAGLDDERLEGEELFPRIDLANISRQYASPEDTRESAEDIVARLFQLEGRRGVFLEADERATTLVIDLEEDERRRVKRVRTTHVTPGMFLLLREGGAGGDYLVPIADKVLGDRAAVLREFQKRWKKSLRSFVMKFGMPEVVRRLRDLGSMKANEVNLRNWMSERNIRTDDPRDFKAVMTLIGLGKESDRCWTFARTIASAHQKAGGVVRKLLLRQVLRSDLGELEKTGKIRFELAEVGGNPLVALRVVRLSPQVTRVSASNAGKLIELEDFGWQE